MVKSKKKTSSNSRQIIKSKKLQSGSGYAMPQGTMGGSGSSLLTFGNIQHGSKLVSQNLETMRHLQDSTKQATYIISALEAPKWGTSKGASSYIKIKNSLMTIRRANIEALENIVNILGESTATKQKRAMTEIKKLGRLTNTSRYQKILQNKRDIDSSFKNVSVPRKNDKSEMHNTVSQRVHLARSNVLQDITALVRIETLKLNAVLMRVIKDKGTQSFERDTDY
jgi:hypothetical protein